MSIFTNLAVPTTLNDLLQARDDALRLLGDARRTADMAAKLLAQHGPYLMPHGAKFPEDEKRVRSELDSSMWRRAFDMTGFKQLMDAQAVAEFEKSLLPLAPEFTEANIRATFIDLRLKAEMMFRRGLFDVFRYLSDDYRTNAKEPFRIGSKVVMSGMVCRSYRRGLQINYGWASDKLNDLDRVVKTVDGKPFLPRTLETAMTVAFEDGQVFQDTYYRAKAFKNGNLHLEFLRLDLLEKVNEQIAECYADGALPDARAA
ncbi:DUF4942 domain-containing protein [Pseudomonas sp. R9.37]|uniref:DUF4942 domain-containing protein n=1 Tax=Pseudomonas sp. R9.37 TaxID=1390498 RepID=UPI000D0D3106|nr:DUF4942 domain-containing protein [Pseudomonas sp. R9.37]PSL90799.1 hypothetical protein C7U57_28725 [Pseudomonas sp. R9.37]